MKDTEKSITSQNDSSVFMYKPAMKKSRPKNETSILIRSITVKNYEVGNPKKLKWAITRFRENATIHGLGYFFQKKSSCCSSCLWKTLFVFCLLGVISSLTNIMAGFSKSARFLSTSQKDYEDGNSIDELFPNFPRITICRKPPWNDAHNDSTRAVLEYGFIALGYPYDSVLPFDIVEQLVKISENRSKEIEEIDVIYNAYMNERNVDAKEFITHHSMDCEDIFIRCVYSVFQVFNCCHHFEPVLTSSGMCFAFHPTDADWMLRDPSAATGFPFILDMHSPRREKSKSTQGFTVTTSHPKEDARFVDPDKAEYLLANAATSLKIALTLLDRRASYIPWYPSYAFCPAQPVYMEPDENLRERFDFRACALKIIFEYVGKFCNCTFILFPHEGTNLPYCKPVDAVLCFLTTFHDLLGSKSLQNELEMLESECKPPCFEYLFHMSSSTANIGDENITRLIFRFNTNDFTLKTQEYKSVTFFISQAGGALGLYLGASLVTVVEVIVFLVLCLWYRFVPSKKRKIGDRWGVSRRLKSESIPRIKNY